MSYCYEKFTEILQKELMMMFEFIYDGNGKPVDLMVLDVSDNIKDICHMEKEEAVDHSISMIFPNLDSKWIDFCCKHMTEKSKVLCKYYFSCIDQELTLMFHKLSKDTFMVCTVGIEDLACFSENLPTKTNEGLYIKQVVDYMQEMVLQVNDSLKIKYINNSLSKTSGYFHTDLFDCSLLDFIHPCDKENAEKIFRSSLQNLANAKAKFRIRKKNNEYIWVEALGSVFYRANGIKGIVFTIKDITNILNIKAKLESSEERFERIFMASSFGIVLFDNDFNLVDMNPAAFQFAKIKNTDLFKHHNLSKIGILSKDKINQLKKGTAVSMNLNLSPKTLNKIHKHKAEFPNMSIFLHVVITPLNDNKGYMAQFKDVTSNVLLERKLKKDKQVAEKAKLEIAQSKKKYKSLVQIMPDALLLAENGIIKFTNKITLRMLGAKNAKELIGRNLIEFVHPDYREDYVRYHRAVSESKQVVYEEKLIGLNREILDVEVRLLPFSPGEGNLTMIIIRDMSEQKKIETTKRMLMEALENDRLRTEFFANLSHELRTPINVIYSALQVMDLYANNQLPNINGINKYCGIIKQNCHRLIRLVNNLIDVTKIDAGFFELHSTRCDIVNMVKNIIDSVEQYVTSKNMSISLSSNCDEKFICCDLDAMERILLNLISNSVKFGKKNEHIWVCITDMHEKVVISVKDDGIGIPSDKQKNIFDRFTRVDGSFKRPVEGSGIGLSLVKSLVELHNGIIELNSEPGNGCEFTITLPSSSKNLSSECSEDETMNVNSDLVGKMTVEFSDIYS